MNRTKILAILVSMLLCLSIVMQAQASQEDKIVSIPESQLTEQQKTSLKLQQIDTTVEKAHGWVGIGKELGQAFDSALGSLTTRSNEFASTKIGKFTMFIVAWKVMGDDAGKVLNACVHILGAMIELLIFTPLFIWSYRNECMDRKVCTNKEGGFWGKRTWEFVKYGPKDKFTPRHGHAIALTVFTLIWLVTIFSY